MEFLIMIPIVIGVLIRESYQKREAKKYAEEHLEESVTAFKKKWHMD